jgi:predicted NBD/HSP70 family sugar kinase
MDKMRITIYDADGLVVTDEEIELPTATQEQIDAMVQMIEEGHPAWYAASVIMEK